MKPYSLKRSLELYRSSKEAKKITPNFEKYLSLALRRCVIPALDPEVPNLTIKEFEEYSTQITVDQLRNALELFEQKSSLAIQEGRLSQGTRDNYYYPLKQFIVWMQDQVWWHELFPSLTKVAPPRATIPKKPAGKRSKGEYSFKLEKLPDFLQKEIEDFKEFRLSGGKSLRQLRRKEKRKEGGCYVTPEVDTVKPSGFKGEQHLILCFFGWYSQTNHHDEWHLKLLTEISLLEEFADWLINVREVTYARPTKATKVGIEIAKWLNYVKSNRSDWSDVPLVLELRDLKNEYEEIYKQQKKKSDKKKQKLKELSHIEARQVVQFLYGDCAPNKGKLDQKTGERKNHGLRQASAVARNFQIYLVVKFFVYCPVRQEEVRGLQLGETLFRKTDSEGNPYYVVKHEEHKEDGSGNVRHYRLPSILTADLDVWIYKWRPLIEEALKTPEDWMAFGGYPPGSIESLRQRVEAAKRGEVSNLVRSPIEKYIKNGEDKLRGMEKRLAAWSIAKANLESHNYLFFMFGKSDARAFGKPHNVTSIWEMVSENIARGCKKLFKKERWTNPHILRNIAEKHIRQLKKSDILDSFGTLIGHSKEMGDEYAAQLMSEYELTEDIVDDWWVEP